MALAGVIGLRRGTNGESQDYFLEPRRCSSMGRDECPARTDAMDSARIFFAAYLVMY